MTKTEHLPRLLLSDVWRHPFVTLLVLAIVTSAVLVVQQAWKYRTLNQTLVVKTAELRQLDVEWRKLRLEHQALAEPARVEQLARKKLKMQAVSPEKEVVVR
ncbi:MAG: cell division protein FtsL [Gammaproteobacteria bacterium]|nr:MAG: cell division protein FtsL [Gammaproteobacteria bacterium]